MTRKTKTPPPPPTPIEELAGLLRNVEIDGVATGRHLEAVREGLEEAATRLEELQARVEELEAFRRTVLLTCDFCTENAGLRSNILQEVSKA